MKSTERFSSNVEDYIKFRPGYTKELIEFISQACGGITGKAIADVGSGTGKLTEPLLAAGAKVVGIEPNGEMRDASIDMLLDYKGFASVNGTAETTGLPARSVDSVVAAQAFHWFDQQKAGEEFKRILKNEDGFVFLIWNNRNNDEEFMKTYEEFLLKYSTDYKQINHKNLTEAHLNAFFGSEGFETAEFENDQHFDFDGLKGRYDSCSYALPDTHELYPESISSLQSLFDQYSVDGQITMFNNTTVHFGKL